MIEFLLAANIVLYPFGNYLGEIKELPDVCEFRYSPGTILTPDTKLTVNPYSETYGANSVVNEGDGMRCGNCAVSEIIMDASGITILVCEIAK